MTKTSSSRPSLRDDDCTGFATMYKYSYRTTPNTDMINISINFAVMIIQLTAGQANISYKELTVLCV